ncbi:5-formyltetrahydrofolate cyclo-ligase [Lactobacillus sp. PV037]|uniref:5-formyltetrahydrofolate cyclo-ligase n=1 Tax=Lactobacillus sp. PV037 TaxID=2594496 RepID=UPI00223EA52A|nr:5-formyltetrahydrofolate cyclo-ligase [Lactobacillus sp. PV037]QNQ83947.1 5-formyltetrahydrofolate cyclo-ligase [Lactobacillus sp. PV037]
MDKKEVRQHQIKLLKEFSKTSQKLEEDKILMQQLLASAEVEKAHSIGISFSMDFEVNTQEIIEKLWQAGKEVYIPRCLPKRQMEFTKFTTDTVLTTTSFGVKENHEKNAQVKNDLDLLVVPLLAFSSENHARLGFGGGYYDRFLAKYSSNAISLVNSKQLYQKNIWEIEKTDVPIRKYLTI